MSIGIIFLGIIMAGSDGYWFPWINLFGGFLMCVGGLIMKEGRVDEKETKM